MGLKLIDLLKWKTTVILLNPNTGNPILDDKERVVTVELRVIGDDDLEKAHQKARIHSANVRRELGDTNSDVYKDRILPIMDATRENCITTVKQFRLSNVDAEAQVAVIREDLPEIDEFAKIPDAPTLEEQEELDQAIIVQDARYLAALKEYRDTRETEVETELNALSDEELQNMAKEDMVGLIALTEFFTELMNEKVQRAAYMDKTFTVKAFDTVEDFKREDSRIKQQLIDTYLALETGADEIKK